MAAINDLVGVIAEHPQRFQATHRDLRRALLRRFPQSIFYRLVPDHIVVVVTVEQWLKEQVHTLGELTRFTSTRKVAAYVGFDPMEDSSAERKVYGGISKAGSRLLRYLLVEAGQTACKHDEGLKQF